MTGKLDHTEGGVKVPNKREITVTPGAARGKEGKLRPRSS